MLEKTAGRYCVGDEVRAVCTKCENFVGEEAINIIFIVNFVPACEILPKVL
ncbi:MAG: hypothetical protein MJE68_00430 [Proteobacteria bacterium]|nr:hypothetical protein [Pseudomonadota bacterium]